MTLAALALALVSIVLPARWTPLRPHPVQQELWNSSARFITVPAGRRSGKTELAKRRLVLSAMDGTDFFPARFFAGAPTRDQAKRLYWDDLKALSPPELIAGKPQETELLITYVNGSQIQVVGLDKPQRVEGTPWDGCVIDEIADVKATTWPNHVRPALSDRRGWAWLIGVPEGRNHYYELHKAALADTTGTWKSFTWPSADILPPEEIEAARLDLDPLVFDQEYGASFLNFTGRAYYAFLESRHCAQLAYDPKAPLILCFDFNVSPGVAVVAQEQLLPNKLLGTGVIGEVWIKNDSNTEMVCRRLIHDWGKHEGEVQVYGDATGGARGTAQVEGSDIDLIERQLRPTFGQRLSFHIPTHNPAERARVNAMNSRLLNGAGEIRLMVDPARAPHVVTDLEGVRVVSGGSGELDKKHDKRLTHPTDALGYYVEYRFPITAAGTQIIERPWG